MLSQGSQRLEVTLGTEVSSGQVVMQLPKCRKSEELAQERQVVEEVHVAQGSTQSAQTGVAVVREVVDSG